MARTKRHFEVVTPVEYTAATTAIYFACLTDPILSLHFPLRGSPNHDRLAHMAGKVYRREGRHLGKCLGFSGPTVSRAVDTLFEHPAGFLPFGVPTGNGLQYLAAANQLCFEYRDGQLMGRLRNSPTHQVRDWLRVKGFTVNTLTLLHADLALEGDEVVFRPATLNSARVYAGEALELVEKTRDLILKVARR